MKTFLFCCLTLLFVIPTNSQSVIDKTIVSGGITRSYKLYIPASYSGSTAVPLVLNLHGRGSNSAQQMIYGDFRSIADTANFIIVHPQGEIHPTWMSTYWNAYFGQTLNDIGFLSNLIDTISSNYNIDANRIHSTGMSNGGYMSLALALGLNDKIASVASVTGTMVVSFPATLVSTKPISVLQIHGTADSTVNYLGDGTSMSVQNVLNYWIGLNGTTTTPTTYSVPNSSTTDNCTAVRYTYGGGTNNTEVIHYKINGGGHTWPGSAINIGVTNKDFNASEVIWHFFNKHQRLNVIGVNEKPKSNLVSFVNDLENNRLIVKNASANTALDYVIYDLQGKIVSENQLVNSTSIVSTQQFNSGLYIMKIREAKTSKISSYKFVVR